MSAAVRAAAVALLEDVLAVLVELGGRHVERDADVLPRLVPGRLRSPASPRRAPPRCDGSIGAKPPSSPTAVESPILVSTFLSAWKTSTPIRRPSAKVSAPIGTTMNSWASTLFDACAPPLRMFIIGTGITRAIGPAEVAVERKPAVLGRRAGHGQRHREDGVGAELGLVGRAVGIHHLGVDRDLVRRIDALEPRARAPRSRSGPPRSTPLPPIPLGVAVAQLGRLVLAGGRAARHRRAPAARRWRGRPRPRRSGLPRLSRISRPCTSMMVDIRIQ